MSGVKALHLHSDLELLQGYAQFSQLYEVDPKCHEALYGLGRINYVQQRYELAEKLLIKAYTYRRDFTYRLWLGYT